MKKRLDSALLPAEGVKIPNSSIVKVEGVEHVAAFFVKTGRAEEMADRARTREVRANMLGLAERQFTLKDN